MATETHVSPDGLLRLVIVSDGGDISVGFEGCAWHTHGDILAATSGLPERAAVDRLVGSILRNEAIIAVARRGGALLDAWVTEEPEHDLRQKPDGEEIGFRHWDGSTWLGPPAREGR